MAISHQALCAAVLLESLRIIYLYSNARPLVSTKHHMALYE